MRPRRDLRNHAAKYRMVRHLAQHQLGQDVAVPVQHGGGGLVARAFNS
jgi:hypothetical protein